MTNTSALSVTELAAAPAPPRAGGRAALLQPGAGDAQPSRWYARCRPTAGLVDRLVAFVESIEDKVPGAVKDRPGFLVNALLMPYLNDVIQEYDDELATAEDIDVALEAGPRLPDRARCELLDMIGLDVHLHATEAALRAPPATRRYAPPPLLSRMVAAGRLGNKSGRGFRARDTSEGESRDELRRHPDHRRRPGPDDHDQPARRRQQAPPPDLPGARRRPAAAPARPRPAGGSAHRRRRQVLLHRRRARRR